MTLQEMMNLLNNMKIEEIELDRDISGTRANILNRLITKYFNSLEHAKVIGYVGVGCISYAEWRTDVLKRRIDRMKT
jgi:hypothetical protein